MVTRTQLQQRTLQQSIQAGQVQRQLEAQRQQLESQRRAEEQKPKSDAQRIAYAELKLLIRKTIEGRRPTFYRGKYMSIVKKAFSDAGLDPELGVQYYKLGVSAKGTPYERKMGRMAEFAYGKPADASSYSVEEIGGKKVKVYETAVGTRQQEQQRYEQMGYGKSEALRLAQMSIATGSVFTPTTAQSFAKIPIPTTQPTTTPGVPSFLQPQFETQAQREFYQQYAAPRPQPLTISAYEPTLYERFTGLFERRGLRDPVTGVREIVGDIPGPVEVLTAIGEAPGIRQVMELSAKETALIDVGPTPADIIPGFKEMTVGEVVATPASVIKFTAEEVGAGWQDIYKTVSEATGVSLVGIPKENRVEVARLEKQFREGKINRAELTEKTQKLKTRVTPEAFGKGVETVVGLGGYVVAGLIPGGLPILLASEVESARQDFQNASELAEKEADKSYKEYLKQPLEEGFEYATEEEFMDQVVPQLETEIKNQALMAMGMSAGFLIGGAALKLGGKLMRYVPRKKFNFKGRKLSQVKYNKAIEAELTAKQLPLLEKKLLAKEISKKGTGARLESQFFGKGVSKDVARKTEQLTIADDLFNMKIFKTRKEALKFVESKSIIKTTIKSPETTLLRPKGPRIEIGGADIRRATLESYTWTGSIRKKGVDKAIQISFQSGARGTPINLQYSIMNIPKGSKYADLLLYNKGQKGFVNLADRYVVKIEGKVGKVDETLFRRSIAEYRRVDFKKTRIRAGEMLDDIVLPTKGRLKNLFDTGTKVEKQVIFERLTPTGFEARLKGIESLDKFGIRAEVKRVYDVKIVGRGIREGELIKPPKWFKELPKFTKKTPFAKTFEPTTTVGTGTSPLTLKQVQVLELPTPSLIIVPKIKPPIIKAAKVVAPPSPKELPFMVGGLGLKEIPFAGTGLYEVTEPAPSFVSLPGKVLPLYEGPAPGISVDRFETLSVVKEAIIEPTKVIERPSIILGLKPRLRVEEITKLKPLTRLELTPVIKPVLLPKVREITRVAQVPALRPRLVQKLKVAQTLVTPTLAVSVAVPRLQPLRPRITKRPIIKIPTLEVPSMIRRPPRKEPVPKVGYGIEIKRRGKWEKAKIPYAFATEEGAHAVAMEKVLKEAAASYRLVKSKKPVKRTRKRPTALHKIMFRPGKEAGVKVQKRLLRITSPGEVREISLAGAAARRGVSTWGFGKPIKKAKRKVTKKRKATKKKGGKKKR